MQGWLLAKVVTGEIEEYPPYLHEEGAIIQVGFYSGVGYKTAMGLGQMRLKP